MAHYVCPCCGQSFNGKKCRNCYYETFDDDISRNLHNHQQANMADVPAAPVRPATRSAARPVARPTKVQLEWERQKRDFRRSQDRKRRQKGFPKWLIWVLVFMLLEPVLAITMEIIEGITYELREPDAPEPEAVITEDFRPVYSGQGFTLYIADPEGDAYPLILENTTEQDVHFSIDRLIVDGFQSERSHAYCSANAGTTMDGRLMLEPEDMRYATMSTPGQITAEFQIYDADSYEDILNATFTIDQGPGDPAPAPAGEILLDREDVHLRYLGYVEDTWEDSQFWDGHLEFYLENNTGSGCSLYAMEAKFDGEETDLGMWVDLTGNTRTVTRMWLYALEDLENLDISGSLELHLVANWDNGEMEDLGWVTIDVL